MDKGSSRPGLALLAASLALFLVDLDFFALNLALPGMADELGVSTTDLQWVISGYMLALGAFLIPGGRLGDILGRRRTLIYGLAIFAGASTVCGLVDSAQLVIVFRIVQGRGRGDHLPALRRGGHQRVPGGAAQARDREPLRTRRGRGGDRAFLRRLLHRGDQLAGGVPRQRAARGSRRSRSRSGGSASRATRPCRGGSTSLGLAAVAAGIGAITYGVDSGGRRGLGLAGRPDPDHRRRRAAGRLRRDRTAG